MLLIAYASFGILSIAHAFSSHSYAHAFSSDSEYTLRADGGIF